MTSYTDKQVADLLKDVLDKDKVLLTCAKHFYLGSSTPPDSHGCKNCWEAYYWYMIATTPPHLRQERLAMLESAVMHAVESVERGEFDLELQDRPTVTIEKDAYPDVAKKPN